jgi:hypothetical protein
MIFNNIGTMFMLIIKLKQWNNSVGKNNKLILVTMYTASTSWSLFEKCDCQNLKTVRMVKTFQVFPMLG